MLFETLTQDISQLEANLCYAFVDPTRIQILYALNDQPFSVNELTRKLKSTQSKISRHLKVLRDHGLVHTTRNGVSVTYQLADSRLITALDILHEVLRDALAMKASIVANAE
jgi:ArsR family transcriptional regulator